MRVRWSAKARADLRAIKARRRHFSERGSARLLQRFRAAAKTLSEHPDAGRVIPEFRNPLLRELIEDDFRVMYERFPDRIEIFTVIHGRVNFDPDRDLS